MLNISVTICDIQYLSWLIPMLAWLFPWGEMKTLPSINQTSWMTSTMILLYGVPSYPSFEKKIEFCMDWMEVNWKYTMCCHSEARPCFRFMARSYHFTSRRHLILINDTATTVATTPIWIACLWQGGYPNCFTCLIRFLELQALIDVEAWNWNVQEICQDLQLVRSRAKT